MLVISRSILSCVLWWNSKETWVSVTRWNTYIFLFILGFKPRILRSCHGYGPVDIDIPRGILASFLNHLLALLTSVKRIQCLPDFSDSLISFINCALHCWLPYLQFIRYISYDSYPYPSQLHLLSFFITGFQILLHLSSATCTLLQHVWMLYSSGHSFCHVGVLSDKGASIWWSRMSKHQASVWPADCVRLTEPTYWAHESTCHLRELVQYRA